MRQPATALGYNVRKRRMELGWSQEELSRRAGLGRNTATRVERFGALHERRGRPKPGHPPGTTWATITALAGALGCSIRDLTDDVAEFDDEFAPNWVRGPGGVMRHQPLAVTGWPLATGEQQ